MASSFYAPTQVNVPGVPPLQLTGRPFEAISKDRDLTKAELELIESATGLTFEKTREA